MSIPSLGVRICTFLYVSSHSLFTHTSIYMNRFIAIMLILLCSAGSINAQYLVKGNVTDTLNNLPLYMSSVVLIRAADSVIESHGRAGTDGRVQLSATKPGKYIIKAMYHGFADYVDAISISKPVTDLGIIPMVSKEKLLKEFVLTRQIAAIKIKGDTTEYIADSFKTKENATVEDLLKKLPGIQVDKNGQIVAQGETVAKILVDGEEFFSDDPKVVTKGLQAKAVDKVQVFDKKSDQAEFTGIDDGQKTKTINLELKEEYKKGYFGKVDAGGGTDGYFQDQAMINAFKSKRQVSAFAIASNTDKVGLGWRDNEKFSSGNGSTEITEDGGIMTTYSSGDDDFAGWDGSYSGEGLPKTWTGGLHYADKWNEGKEHISANYRYAMQNVEINGVAITENPYSLQHSDKTQFSKGDRHGVDGMFEWKLDTSTTIKLNVTGGLKSMQTKSDYVADGFNTNLNTGSSNIRHITSNSDGQFFNADLLLRKKFAKKGRTLSVDVKENQKRNSSNGNLTSYISGYTRDTAGNIVYSPVDTTNQKKENASNILAFSAKATYTEPLSKKVFLEINYSTTVDNSTSKILSTDNGEVQINSLYSSNYKFNILTNRGGLNLKYNIKKINIAAGCDVANTDYNQEDILLGINGRRRNFNNFFPSASFTYKLGRQTSLNIYYHGSTTQPTINQIQPLTQNTDPYNITIGNTALKQEFNNNINLRFNDYKVLTGRYTYGGLTFSSTSDAISTAQSINSNGVNTTQYVNVNGNYTGYGYIGGGIKIPKTIAYIGGNFNPSISRIHNFINNQANVSDNRAFNFGLDFNADKEGKYEIRLNPSIAYNENKASVGNYNVHYTTFSTSFSGSYQLPKKFEIGSSVDLTIREKTKVFTTNNNVVIWNAYVGKKFLKNGQLEARINALDILNQNIGFARSIDGATTNQNSYNTIRRYGMLNLIWNFTHTPTGAQPATPGAIIIKK